LNSILRRTKEKIKGGFHSLFVLGQHFGFDLLPRHFYSQIPDFRQLRRDRSWMTPRTMFGVQGAEVDRQLCFVQCCASEHVRKLLHAEDVYPKACSENGEAGYGKIESDFLFCYMAACRPRHVVQVGGGVSTAVMLHAAGTFGIETEITCIDPYPTDFLRSSAEQGRIQLIPRRFQEVGVEICLGLGEGDLLFIDSTHTVKPGSEVNLIILEALPRLRTGCRVHFHDIDFPYDYHPRINEVLFFWGESTLLHAFLACNPRFTIDASLSMLHSARCAELIQLFPDYRPSKMDQGIIVDGFAGHFPNSIYLRVVA
jgi:hypothetical protein